MEWLVDRFSIFIYSEMKKWKFPKPVKGGVDKEKNAIKWGVFCINILICRYLALIKNANL